VIGNPDLLARIDSVWTKKDMFGFEFKVADAVIAEKRGIGVMEGEVVRDVMLIEDLDKGQSRIN
jgi:hypothetical protein